MEADIGSTASLVCDVDGNPAADIVWISEATERVCPFECLSSTFVLNIECHALREWYRSW